MDRYVLVVPSAAHEGRDDEFNSWYDTIHLADLLTIPGVRSGRRFDAAAQSPMAPPAPYLAIYEVETDDPGAIFAEIGRRARAGEMAISPALDSSRAPMWLYRAR